MRNDEATEWYISRSHAVRALGYVGASLAEAGDLSSDFEQPKLLDLFADGLARTISMYDLSPVDARQVSDAALAGEAVSPTERAEASGP